MTRKIERMDDCYNDSPPECGGKEQSLVQHPAITHCDNCGCDWLDNGLNPIGCPYCTQPTAVDGSYPAPRNRAEAAALARMALAYLDVVDAHIDAAIARCETDLAAPQPPAEVQAQGGGEVVQSGWYYTDTGQRVQVWRITQDDGCWCSDLKYHCSSKLHTTPPSAPVGWKLVPVEPTPEMRQAYHDVMEAHESATFTTSPDDQWHAMLAAAPALARQASAPVGVEGLIEDWESALAEDKRDGVSEVAIRVQEIHIDQLRALAQRPVAVDRARFRKAPCYLCGYNGPGYYQPDTHPCAEKYHAD